MASGLATWKLEMSLGLNLQVGPRSGPALDGLTAYEAADLYHRLAWVA